MTTEMHDRPESGVVRTLRLFSALAAFGVVALITLYPRAVAAEASSVPHGWLVLMMIGMSLCWLHAFGFRPQSALLRILLSPLAGWLCLTAGVCGVFF